MRFFRRARAHFFLRDFTSAATDAFFFCNGTFRDRARGVFFSSFHIDSHGRIFLLQRDFSRSGKGACFFRDFTSIATHAFFFCDGTIHDRVKAVWFFSSFHIDSHRRVFLLQWDFSRSGKGRAPLSETPYRGGHPLFSVRKFRRQARRKTPLSFADRNEKDSDFSRKKKATT